MGFGGLYLGVWGWVRVKVRGEDRMRGGVRGRQNVLHFYGI